METAISTHAPDERMVRIPGGTFTMGSDRHYPEEAPAHRVRISGFWMDQVWEWTTDWYQPGHRVSDGACCSLEPVGPALGQRDPAAPDIPMRAVKGGSFLCSRNFCARYRPAARSSQAVDTSACHIGSPED